MTDAVLLDLDGTLSNSHPGIVTSLHHALRSLGHEPPQDDDLLWMIGPPIEDGMRVLLARYGDDRVDEAILSYRGRYETIGLFETSAYPGIPALLAALVASGLRLFLATSKRETSAKRILERLGLLPHLEAVYGCDDDPSSAEKPELIRRVVARHRLDPKRSIMVGDRRYDIAGAHANRMRGIGVLWGYGTRDELEQAGADALIETPADLPALLTA